MTFYFSFHPSIFVEKYFTFSEVHIKSMKKKNHRYCCISIGMISNIYVKYQKMKGNLEKTEFYRFTTEVNNFCLGTIKTTHNTSYY